MKMKDKVWIEKCIKWVKKIKFVAFLRQLFGLLRNPCPYRERITADMRLQPSASAQILVSLGLLIFAKRYMKCDDDV
jgi:hypothetical protein